MGEALFEFSENQEQSCYIEDFRRWADQDAGKLPMRDAILCVGSSTLRMWADIQEDLGPGLVLNRGFGGSKMSDVLPFNDFFARYEAEKVLIYEGDNDLAGGTKNVGEMLGEFREFCNAIWAQRGDTRIYILAIKPSPSRRHLWETVQHANNLLTELCESDERLTYIDIVPAMLGADGLPHPRLFIADNLHMTRAGYERWRDAVRPLLLG